MKTVTLKTKPQEAQGHGNNCTSRMRQKNLYLLLKKIGVDNSYKKTEDFGHFRTLKMGRQML